MTAGSAATPRRGRCYHSIASRTSSSRIPTRKTISAGAVALSGDGNTLAVGAYSEASGTGSEADNSQTGAGAVYVFTRGGGGWSQQAYLKARYPEVSDRFGYDVKLSYDGSVLAVAAPNEDGGASGINGIENDNSSVSSGALYVFERTAAVWTQTDNSATDAGAAYIFVRDGASWRQRNYVKPPNVDAGDGFGYAVAISSDRATLVITSTYEDSVATGINGDQGDNAATNAGAAYVFQ